MKFIYNTDSQKYEYLVRYIDQDDFVNTTYVEAYSEKQAQFYVAKNYKDCYRVVSVEEIREIDNGQGKQVMMDFS